MLNGGNNVSNDNSANGKTFPDNRVKEKPVDTVKGVFKVTKFPDFNCAVQIKVSMPFCRSDRAERCRLVPGPALMAKCSKALPQTVYCLSSPRACPESQVVYDIATDCFLSLTAARACLDGRVL